MAQQKRRRKSTENLKAEFLEALSHTAIVTVSCEVTGLSRRSIYNWRAADANFAAAWEESLEQATERLEEEVRRRAVDGVDEPVFHQGEICGYRRKFSDLLLMFLLKKRKPEYRDNAPPPPPQRVTFIMQVGSEERHLGSFEPPLIEGDAEPEPD